jgi:hypothetical protein
MPKAREFHRHVDFPVADDNTALDVAARFFRLHKAEGIQV